MNSYISILSIAMCVSLAQAESTYSIKGRITSITGLDAKPLRCDADTGCWLLNWHGDDKLQIGAQVEVTEKTGRTAYSNVENSTLILCKSYENGTWAAAAKMLLVQALFPTGSKSCPLDGTHPYFVYELMEPVTITMNSMLDCGDFIFVANLNDDYFQDEGPDTQNPIGQVTMWFTIPDNGDCNKS